MPNENIKIYDWVHFAQSYLHSARLLCEAMLSNSRNTAGAFIPMMYMVKHGIEVFIKMSFVMLNDELGDGQRIHNSKKLFRKIQDLISSKHTTLKAELEKRLSNERSKADPDSGEITNLEIAINELTTLPNDMQRLSALILKYHHCSVIDEKLIILSVEDHQNDFFRFPDSQVKIGVDYDQMLEAVEETDITEIKNDVEALYRLFNDLGFLLDVYKQTT